MSKSQYLLHCDCDERNDWDTSNKEGQECEKCKKKIRLIAVKEDMDWTTLNF
jgi:hypothetical protein